MRPSFNDVHCTAYTCNVSVAMHGFDSSMYIVYNGG